MTPRVTFYTRPECHLCHAARYIMERVARDIPVDIEYIDISADADLEAKYGHDIPVLLIDGVEHARHRVIERDLRRALAERGE